MNEEEEQIIIATYKFNNQELNKYYKELQLETKEDNLDINGVEEKQAATEKAITEVEMNDEVDRLRVSHTG